MLMPLLQRVYEAQAGLLDCLRAWDHPGLHSELQAKQTYLAWWSQKKTSYGPQRDKRE